MLRLLCSLALAALLAGCQNPWKDFYQGAQLPADAPDNGLPDCRQVSDFDAAIKEYMRENYFPFGQSVFNAGNNVGTGDMQDFGATIKADVILYAVGNRTTTQSAMALPQYNPGTQQTTYLNGYGYGGTFSGTATTYTPGTYSSQVVPVTVTRMDYSALFLRKRVTRPALGISVRGMTSAEASSVGTNSAVAIELVMRNTPAFEADVMDGDFLLEIDGLKIPDVPTFLSTIDAKRGQTIRVLLSRPAGTRPCARSG